MNLSQKLFKHNGKSITYEDLLREISVNSQQKRESLQATFDGLKPLVVTLSDAVTLMPTLVELQDLGIKNDEQLIKMANIVSRLMNKQKQSDDNDMVLSDDDKRALLEEAHRISEVTPGPR